MTSRLLVVLSLVALFAAAPPLYRRRRVRLEQAVVHHPPVPPSLRSAAQRTWLLFTTPWCASCGPVEARLRASDPTAAVVRIDVTREPGLARAFTVRSAPTALLTDSDGVVQERLVGADAVDRYVLERQPT